MRNKINKSIFIEQIAVALRITESQAEKTLNTIIGLIYEDLRLGKTVNISGFGQFSTVYRKGRLGVNPRTLKPMMLPDFNHPKFKAGEAFKSAVKLRK